jgi:bla regulator protein blaR1
MTPESLSLTLPGLAPALKDHIWQSTIFLLIAALLTLALRHNHARIRYCLWLAASIKFLIPFALLITLGSHLATPRATPPPQTAVYFAMEEVSQPFTIAVPTIVAPTPTVTHHVPLLPIVLGATWLIGFVVVLTVWFVYWRRISAIVRAATPLREGRELQMLRRLEDAAGLRKQIEFLASPSQLGPGIYGILRPSLIWPSAISQRLDDAHLESIFAHEICHVRRRDNLTAALHMLVEAIFWFHPLVWWLGARLEAERERACDESVLESSSALTTQPHIYAESILKICEFYVESPLPCISGVTGAELKKRIVDILDKHATLKLSLSKRLLLSGTMLMVVAIPVFLGAQASTLSRSEDWQTLTGGKMEFEVASIRENKSGDSTRVNFTLGPGNAYASTGGRFSVTSLPILDLIRFAYKLSNGQTELLQSHAPSWITTERFDIQATSENHNPTKDQMRLMAQSLLAERFNFRVHTEIRQLPILAMVLARPGKLGPQLRQHPADDPSCSNLARTPNTSATSSTSSLTLAGFPIVCGGITDAGGASVPSHIRIGARDIPLSLLASNFGGFDLPLVDRTGLTGTYDFVLEWGPDPKTVSSLPATSSDPGTNLQEAMLDQLGLKLQRQKGPINVFIIDHIDHPSSQDQSPSTASLPIRQTVQSGAELPQDERANTAQTAHPHLSAQPAPPWLPGSATSIPLGANGKPLTFDIVSFRRTQTMGSSRVDLPETGDFIAYHGQPLSRVIYFAYLAIGPKLIGGPDWLDKDLYDFQAKVAAEDVEIWQKTDLDAKRLMVRSLLADVLKLKVHANETPENVYELVVAKGGPKLKEYVEGETKTFPDGFVVTGSNSHWASPAEFYSQGATLNHLADVLTTYHTVDREVVDRTGLTAKYDYTLPAMPLTPEQADQFNAPSLSSVLQQYGLKLQPGKATYPAIVIDHVEKPSEN